MLPQTVDYCGGLCSWDVCQRPEAVDAQRQANLEHETPFEDQLVCADLVVLNKTDLVDSSTQAQVVI